MLFFAAVHSLGLLREQWQSVTDAANRSSAIILFARLGPPAPAVGFAGSGFVPSSSSVFAGISASSAFCSGSANGRQVFVSQNGQIRVMAEFVSQKGQTGG
jgi:hypothetical protein